jgi:hypothetical protein
MGLAAAVPAPKIDELLVTLAQGQQRLAVGAGIKIGKGGAVTQADAQG